MITYLKPSTVYFYFHLYMTKNVFTKIEEKELQPIYEQLLIDKLKLGSKFPRSVLYINKNVLGIGLMALNTILEILSLKLFFRHTRLDSNTNKLIEVNLQNLQRESGRNVSFEAIPEDEKWWPTTWVYRVLEKCHKRGLIVEHQINYIAKITKNKTIMDYAVEYKKTKVLSGRIN